MNVFALTTRGLETVSAQELAALPDVVVTGTTYRRVTAQCEEPLDRLLTLRTVDDLFIDVVTWQGIDRPRSTLARLTKASEALDLRDAAAACAEVRTVGMPPTFSVTANFVGKRNYTSEEIKLAVADGIEASHGWEYRSDDSEADLNVRVFIEHAEAFVGVRLGRTALHQRPYKLEHLSGSLKPPVAAAMVALADPAPGLRLLDPCCGVGTILIEAALRGLSVRGGDHDPAAIAAAQTNAASAGIEAAIEAWDAQQLPIADQSIDRIVSNLPWGRQIAVDDALAHVYQRLLGEFRRVLVPGGLIAVLTSTPDLIDAPDMGRVEQREISLFGQTPTVVLLTTV